MHHIINNNKIIYKRIYYCDYKIKNYKALIKILFIDKNKHVKINKNVILVIIALYRKEYDKNIKICDGVKKIIFSHNEKIPRFPKSIKYLDLDCSNEKSLKKCPHIDHIFFGENYNMVTKLHTKMKSAFFGYYYDQQTKFNDTLEHIRIGRSFNQIINIPTNIKFIELSFEGAQDRKIFLKSFVTNLINHPNLSNIVIYDTNYEASCTTKISVSDILNYYHTVVEFI